MRIPTIKETQEAYLEIYKENCSEDIATCFIHDFIKYREFADRIEKTEDHKKWCIDPETIEEFISERKLREDRKKDHEEYERMLQGMSPKERWLHIEGFDNPFGEWVEKFLDTEKGKEIFDNVCSIWTDAYPHQLRTVLEGLLEYAKDNQPPEIQKLPNLDEFMATKEAEYILGWFVGICNDGGRAFRTIHTCARAFFLHNWATFKVFESIN